MAKSFNARMAARFKQITASYDKANALVHATALEILDHAKEHGDCSTAQGLVMAMPASTRREMLILWFKTFTPIVVKNDDKWNAKMHEKGTKLFVEWDREGAEAKPFYELANENKERPPLDDEGILKLISQLAGRLTKMSEEGKIRPEFVQSAEEISAQLKRIKVRKVVPSNDDAAGAAAA